MFTRKFKKAKENFKRTIPASLETMIKNSPLGVSSVNRSKISPEIAIGNGSQGVSNVVNFIAMSKTVFNGRRNTGRITQETGQEIGWEPF